MWYKWKEILAWFQKILFAKIKNMSCLCDQSILFVHPSIRNFLKNKIQCFLLVLVYVCNLIPV